MNKRILIASLPLLLFVGCQAAQLRSPEALITTDTAILKTTLQTLNLEKPEADIEVNIGNGDYRFICVCGYACFAPGVEKENLLREKYGYRCLEGTTDMVETGEHMGLINTATQYAEHYNLELLRRLKLESRP